MMTALVVGACGVAGALLRFAVDSWFAHHQGSRPHWPWATLTVNVAGSFIIGWSGGLTGFSSWTTATVRLVSEERYRAAALNIGANLLAGLTAAALGLALAG